jgi:uncharacterized protein YqeY
MGLYEDITNGWKEAMKARDPKKDALASIRTEVKNKVINTRTDGAGEIAAADDLVLEVLNKMAKQRKESITEYQRGGREDLVQREAFELSVIEAFLPKKLSAEEVAALVARPDGWSRTAAQALGYRELAARPGALARLRLAWFVVIAALRDWPLANPDQDS